MPNCGICENDTCHKSKITGNCLHSYVQVEIYSGNENLSTKQ